MIQEIINKENIISEIFQRIEQALVIYRIEAADPPINGNLALNLYYANNKFYELAGYPAKYDVRALFPFLSKSIKRIFHYLKENETYSINHQHSDGKWYEIKASYFGGEKELVLFFINDITEIKLTESNLKNSKEKYLTVAQKAPVSIISFDSNGIIDFVNDYHIERFARNNANRYHYIGKNITELKSHINAGINIEVMKVLEGIPLEIKELFVPEFEGGHSGYINIRVVPVFKDNKIIGGVSIREDITDRVLAEKTWKEQEKRFRLISGLITDYVYSAVVVNNSTVKYEWTTAALKKITGYEENEITNFKDWSDIIIPIDTDIFKNKIRKTLRGEKDVSEYRIITKNGEISWIRDYSYPIWDYNYNRVTNIYGAVKDITENKRTEEAYKVLVDSSMQGLVIIQDNKIVFANPATYLLTGYTIAELMLMDEDTLLGIFHSEDAEMVAEMQSAHLSCKPVPQSFEFRLIKRDGEIRWVECFPSLISYQGKLALQNIFIDVHEKKSAQEDSRRKSEENLMLLDNIDTHIWYLYDPETYGMVNKSHAVFLGKNKRQIDNTKISELFTIEEAGNLIQKNKEVFDKKRQVKSEEWMTDAYGNRKLFRINRTPKLDSNNKVEFVICSATDITTQKETDESIKEMIIALRQSKKLTEDRAIEILKLNNKLTESEAKLIELNNSKDKFFSIISHDLKSPLMGIIGLSKILSAEAEILTKEEITEFSTSLHYAAENLYKLLENLLNWSRLQRGIIEFNPSQFDVNRLINLNIELLKENGRQKQINIHNEFDTEINVFADINMVNTILRNLVSNAVKFTNPGGNIKVTGTSRPDGYIEICVSDDGVGMTPEMMDKIFKPGNVIIAEGTMNEKGTGLGLILCKDLVEKNLGKIWVDSQPGKGSCFCFTLPADETVSN